MCQNHVESQNGQAASDTLTALKRNINLLFNELMDNTIQSAKKKHQLNWNNQLSNLVEMVDKIKVHDSPAIDTSKILEKIENLEKKFENTNSKTYAQIAKNKPTLSTIIIKPKKAESDVGSIHKNLKQVLKDDHSMRVINSTANSRSIRITTDDNKLLDKLKAKISTENPEDVEIDYLKKLDPQISFIIDPEHLEPVETFKKRNGIPEKSSATIVNTIEFPTRSGNNRMRVVIRLDKEARSIINKKAFVFMGAQSSAYKDDFYIRSCSNCNKIGHSTKYCNNQPQCYKCPDNENNHQSLSCDKTNPLKGCLICKNNNLPNLDHVPKGPDCTSYINAIKHLKSITDWEYED